MNPLRHSSLLACIDGLMLTDLAPDAWHAQRCRYNEILEFLKIGNAHSGAFENVPKNGPNPPKT